VSDVPARDADRRLLTQASVIDRFSRTSALARPTRPTPAREAPHRPGPPRAEGLPAPHVRLAPPRLPRKTCPPKPRALAGTFAVRGRPTVASPRALPPPITIPTSRPPDWRGIPDRWRTRRRPSRGAGEVDDHAICSPSSQRTPIAIPIQPLGTLLSFQPSSDSTRSWIDFVDTLDQLGHEVTDVRHQRVLRKTDRTMCCDWPRRRRRPPADRHGQRVCSFAPLRSGAVMLHKQPIPDPSKMLEIIDLCIFGSHISCWTA
jgi:hypothetical protein